MISELVLICSSTITGTNSEQMSRGKPITGRSHGTLRSSCPMNRNSRSPEQHEENNLLSIRRQYLVESCRVEGVNRAWAIMNVPVQRLRTPSERVILGGLRRRGAQRGPWQPPAAPAPHRQPSHLLPRRPPRTAPSSRDQSDGTAPR